MVFFFISENVIGDILHGCLVVTCTLCAFISLVWLREQILHGGGPEWLELVVPPAQQVFKTPKLFKVHSISIFPRLTKNLG